MGAGPGAADVLVVGGGQAAAETVKRLRSFGFDGSVSLVGEEPAPPYERPPLSKALLKGLVEPDRLHLASTDAWAQLGTDVHTGVRVVELDMDRRCAYAEDGRRFGFGSCVLATGARAVPVPWMTDGVGFTLRTVADVARLRACLDRPARVLVVGGGFLGLEAASSMVDMGMHVTLVEAGAGILTGRVSDHAAAWLLARHVERGVDVHRGCLVVELEVRDGAVRAHIGDGAMVEADYVVYAAGALANKELAEKAGASCGRGVLVDAQGRTDVDGLFAAGDVASLVSRSGREVRIESVNNAVTQAHAVAAALAGRDAPAFGVPTFWTEQVGVRLQTAGWIPSDIETTDLVSGDETAWVVERYVAGALVGIEAVNRPVDYLRSLKMMHDLRSRL